MRFYYSMAGYFASLYLEIDEKKICAEKSEDEMSNELTNR